MVLGMPLFGLPLAAWIAFTRYREGDNLIFMVALLLAIVALVELASFESQRGILWELLA